ncbi:MAG: hypothetical protein LUD72_07400 [Bacteroidales bacterium]|nr:hypothetical protein [Bacteroidales bacterium]
MITNLLMRLKDGHTRRGWVDGKKADDVTITRLFRALDKATSYDEQVELVERIVNENCYSKDAVRCFSYVYKKGSFEANQSVYNEDKEKYSRGKHLGTTLL